MLRPQQCSILSTAHAALLARCHHPAMASGPHGQAASVLCAASNSSSSSSVLHTASGSRGGLRVVGSAAMPDTTLGWHAWTALNPSTASGPQGCGSLASVRSVTSLPGMPQQLLRKARMLSLPVGGLAGAVGSLVGVGGGVVISPIIGATCKNLPQRIVSGTSLAAVIATGSASGYVYWSSGFVDLTSALVIGASALLTASSGAAATHKFDCNKLRQFLGWWLLLVAAIVPLKGVVDASTQDQQQHSGQEQQHEGLHEGKGLRPLRLNDAALAAVGGISGFASGLLGIGGGTVVTPMLAMLSGMPQTAVVGTSLAGMILPSLTGLLKHARLQNVDWLMALGLSAGSLLGSYAFSNLALQAPPYAMELAFSAGMLFLGSRTLASLRKAKI